MSLDVDMLCLSHLRWDFVYQRPHHLMTRFAPRSRVFYVEEPKFDGGTEMEVRIVPGGVHVAVPHLPSSLNADELDEAEVEQAEGVIAGLQRRLLDNLIEREEIALPLLWYYTPMAIPFSRHIPASAIVYDCMDELSAFAMAPPVLITLERELFARADLVFTGGRSLYEAKRSQHPAVHSFPSSVDVRHFAAARRPRPDPADQAAIPRPRIGFFGVIDERMDLDLVTGLAASRPDWHVVLIGPTAKVEPSRLQGFPNIHVLGARPYAELPAYVAGWDVAILPFAHNRATAFISPTKTPEYLAAGKPVVATSIRDVVQPYGDLGLVRIADGVPAFVEAIGAALDEGPQRRAAADRHLAGMSWDRVWTDMSDLIDRAIRTPVQSADMRTSHV